MAERVGLFLKCEGVGDCLFAIPVIKKLHQMYSDVHVFDIFTHHPSLFANCPYVSGCYPADEAALQIYAKANRVMVLFEPDKLPHWKMNTCDFISIPLGIGALTFKEKQLEYFPAENDLATEFDVVINTSMTWPTRSWPLDRWQRLADALLARGLSVAVVGKDAYSQVDEMNKRSIPLERCVDLVNRLSLDQTFYTIKKARLFVSCQNGLAVLAGATDTEVVILDKSVDWSRHAVYRKENPLYRATYVKGLCDDYCGVMDNCPKPENQGVFRCIPEYAVVERVVMERLGF